jgi:lipoprotein-anchoring transpeptidase ErfK/SrfK
MKNWFYFIIIALFASLYPSASHADAYENHDKVIFIDQKNQVGAAYGDGKKLLAFPILSGDEETPTLPGTYVIKRKDKNYYSRKYKQPMPYALFFDLKGMRAIHEGDLPEPGEYKEWATHGCIHVEKPHMEWLFDWAETGKTAVVIQGRRIYEEGKNGAREEKYYQPEYREIPGDDEVTE